MHINEYVDNVCYNKEGIWFLEGHKLFDYSDGYQAENYIYQAIKKSSDITYSSRELETHIKDWPSRYHLSRLRSLAYWPLLIPPDASVLEVGSGCGAISRYFGECAGNVLSIEGSPMRAAITRARMRGLNNVEVLCAPFQQIKYNTKFDIIVCNGVFEYSACFVDGDTPYERILDEFKQVLKPGGTLFLAIENKFGLRYFSSSSEEHNQIMFDGIEGYVRHVRGARTFGSAELRQMLEKRFASVEALFPLPDYKLPEAVIRDRLLEIASCAELFGVKSSFDHGAAQRPLFHERLAWRELEKSGLLRHMANSFLFVSSDTPSPLLAPNWLGSNYSINRLSCFTTKTDLHETNDGLIHVQKHRLEPEAALTGNDRLTQVLNDDNRWFDSPSLHTKLAAKMCEQQCGSLRNRFEQLVSEWWREVVKSGVKNLSPDSVDYVWHNVFFENGDVKFIDREWVWNAGVSPQWLIVRAVSVFIDSEMHYIHRWAWQVRFTSEWTIARTVANICNQELSYSSFLTAFKNEDELLFAVTGRNKTVWILLISTLLPLQIRQYLRIMIQKLSIITVKFINIFKNMIANIGN